MPHICLTCNSTNIALIKLPKQGVCGACGKDKPLYIRMSKTYDGQSLCKADYLKLLELRRAVKK
jgi:hypothetical protein